jgi:hypothetical protein
MDQNDDAMDDQFFDLGNYENLGPREIAPGVQIPEGVIIDMIPAECGEAYASDAPPTYGGIPFDEAMAHLLPPRDDAA